MSTKRFAIPTRRLPTKYYKYTYENWTQPIATGQTTAIDGGNMVITATNQYSSAAPWLAMDGTNNLWVMNDTTTGYWQLKLPYKIIVTGLVFYNLYGKNKTRSGRFYTSSTKTTPIGNAFTATDADYAPTTISGIPSEGIETDTIYLDLTGSYNASSGMSELKITAKRRTGSVESTSSDYDYKVTEIKEYLPARRMGIKYYKYGTEPNINIIGSPTISKGVVSGFSTSNYLVLDNIYKATNNVEYVFKFTTGSSFSAQQAVVHAEYLLNIEIDTSGAVTFWNWGGQFSTNLFTAKTNTSYWVKILVNGNSKTYSYSTDGKNYIGTKTVTDNNLQPNNTSFQFRLGLSSYNSSNPFLGSIDLTQTYIKNNGFTWWRGTKAVISNSSDYDYKVIENKEYLPVR